MSRESGDAALRDVAFLDTGLARLGGDVSHGAQHFHRRPEERIDEFRFHV